VSTALSLSPQIPDIAFLTVFERYQYVVRPISVAKIDAAIAFLACGKVLFAPFERVLNAFTSDCRRLPTELAEFSKHGQGTLEFALNHVE
jgi:hypothetical protein